MFKQALGSGGGGGGGAADKLFAIMLLHSLKFDIQHDMVLKKLNFDLSTTRAKGGGGVCGQNICYHVATLCDSI